MCHRRATKCPNAGTAFERHAADQGVLESGRREGGIRTRDLGVPNAVGSDSAELVRSKTAGQALDADDREVARIAAHAVKTRSRIRDGMRTRTGRRARCIGGHFE
jgi:hypothetical protein